MKYNKLKEEFCSELGIPQNQYDRRQKELTVAKKKDYSDYTIAALGAEYRPNSKTKVARDAINDFGKRKYHHSSYKAVAARYVKEPFYIIVEKTNIFSPKLYFSPQNSIIDRRLLFCGENIKIRKFFTKYPYNFVKKILKERSIY